MALFTYTICIYPGVVPLLALAWLSPGFVDTLHSLCGICALWRLRAASASGVGNKSWIPPRFGDLAADMRRIAVDNAGPQLDCIAVLVYREDRAVPRMNCTVG